MRVIITLQKDKSDEDNKLITYVQILQDTDSFKTNIYELEDVEVKKNETLEFYFDKKSQSPKVRVVPIPKTHEQELEERIEAQAKAIEELMEMLGGQESVARMSKKSFI
ncbi:MAG: hypothetical protein Q4D65_08010 [Peptostreptococcaceae bacterium]|nr:hypothetical protein [Peptostreptococcaceae bacterium]